MAEKEQKKVLNRKEVFHALRIYRFILPYKSRFLLGMVALVISTGVVSLIPGGFGKLIDAASPAGINPEKLKETGMILGGVLLVQALLSFVRIYQFEYVSQNAMASIRR